MNFTLRSMALGICACLSVFIACQADAPKSLPTASKHYFDLEGYFKQELEHLGAVGKAKKTVSVGTEKEVLVLDSVAFSKDLQVFSASDINRPAWSDKYTTDSVFIGGALTRLEYLANDEKLKTQRIVLDFDSSKLTSVLIENSASSFIATSHQVLMYAPATGYSIQSVQKVAFKANEELLVAVEFIK